MFSYLFISKYVLIFFDFFFAHWFYKSVLIFTCWWTSQIYFCYCFLISIVIGGHTLYDCHAFKFTEACFLTYYMHRLENNVHLRRMYSFLLLCSVFYRCLSCLVVLQIDSSFLFSLLVFCLVILYIIEGEVLKSLVLLLNCLFLTLIMSGFVLCILGLCCHVHICF